MCKQSLPHLKNNQLLITTNKLATRPTALNTVTQTKRNEHILTKPNQVNQNE